MTAKQFTAWAESAFGKYLPAMKLEVEGWLKAKSAVWIDALRLICLQEHPSIYRVPPGVHEIFALRLLVHPLSHELEDASHSKGNIGTSNPELSFRPTLPSPEPVNGKSMPAVEASSSPPIHRTVNPDTGEVIEQEPAPLFDSEDTFEDDIPEVAKSKTAPDEEELIF